jgi:SAM-dependent methyltransferase
VPLPDASFDLAISEYGASLWCDPYAWIPEAARLLRPGGLLIFLTAGILPMLCDPDEGEDVPTGERLVRPLFGMHRVVWTEEPPSVEFHLPHGEMIRTLRESGFEIEELTEVRPPAGATTRYPHITLEWARQWPCEEIWKARKAS